MKILFADSGSTKTHWALVEEVQGLPKMIRTAQTQGLNPLYVTPEQITSACRQVLADVGEGTMGVDELRFYGSGCSGERCAVVERALRAAFTPMTKVIVDSDLMGAALALETKGEKKPTEPFIACIMGTGSIAALFDPVTRTLQPMPALGYVLGDEGSGAWFGRHLLGDYLKQQMPEKAREAFLRPTVIWRRLPPSWDDIWSCRMWNAWPIVAWKHSGSAMCCPSTGLMTVWRCVMCALSGALHGVCAP